MGLSDFLMYKVVPIFIALFMAMMIFLLGIICYMATVETFFKPKPVPAHYDLLDGGVR